MLQNLSREIFDLGEIIFKEGDMGGCAYLIEEGVIGIYASVNGQEKEINRIGKGELFGEVALIDNKSRTATARVLDQAVLIPIERDLVNELLDKTDPVVRHLLLVILERFRHRSGGKLMSYFDQDLEQPEIIQKRNSLKAEATSKLTMASEIDRALEQGEFEMHYQPICDMATGKVAGYESLIRWRHPSRGMVSPLDFLFIAEQTGQIREIGLWTLDRACRDWPALRKTTDFERPFVSVNMSPSQLTGERFLEEIRDILFEYKMPTSELKLELTETVIIEKPDIALDLLKRLKEMGSSLAIDDFGTGHSSLDILNRYPIGTLKIDLSFVKTMLTSMQSREIVNSSIKLAHSLKMDVVAEGIENEEIRNKLLELGCNFGQGWYFGKPLGLNEISGAIE